MSVTESSRLLRSLRCVDGLAVAYLAGAGVLLVSGCTSRWVYLLCIGLHGVVAAGILLLARARSLPSLLQVVRDTYPLLLLLLLYGEVDLLVRVFYDSPGFDALVRQWDLWLFGRHLHQYLHQWLSGQGWKELFHLLYLSYYVLLIGGFLGVWKFRSATFPRFAFVVTGMFLSFIVIFVVFPVAGPLSASEASFMTAGLFPRLVAWIYAPFAGNGIQAGAFPSSHVGMSVGIVLLLAPRRWGTRVVLGGLVLGIAVSAVYGRFHYAIDAVAGLVAGGLLYLMWTRFYAALQSERVLVPGDGESRRRSEPTSVSPETVPHER